MLLARGASEEMAKATIAAEAAKQKEEEVLKKFSPVSLSTPAVPL